jgi:hypothetical protein
MACVDHLFYSEHEHHRLLHSLVRGHYRQHAMLYTILGLEAPNAARGMINVECPREVYNRLSWQEPVAALPAEWTMFLPLNSR